MTAFNLYTAGTRSSRTRLATAPDFATALRLYEADAAAWSIVPVGEADELAKFGELDSIVPRYDLGRFGTGIYVTRCGDGFTTLGFAHADSQRAKVAAWLEAEGKPLERVEAAPGTPEAFAAYHAAMAAGRAHNAATGRRCEADLTPQLRGLEGKRVEVTEADGTTRRFTVGKSSGWLPIHLEIARRGQSYGESVEGAPFKAVREVR